MGLGPQPRLQGVPSPSVEMAAGNCTPNCALARSGHRGWELCLACCRAIVQPKRIPLHQGRARIQTYFPKTCHVTAMRCEVCDSTFACSCDGELKPVACVSLNTAQMKPAKQQILGTQKHQIIGLGVGSRPRHTRSMDPGASVTAYRLA